MAARKKTQFALVVVVGLGFLVLCCGAFSVAFGVPAVKRYMNHAASFEAINTTRTMANYAVDVYARSCDFPPELEGTIDTKKCCGGQKCDNSRSVPESWGTSTTQLWEPSYFSYSVKREGTARLVIKAVSDFQCGGESHTLTLEVDGARNGHTCTANYGEPVVMHELE